MTRTSDALALQQALRREEAYAARAMGSARVLEAAKASAPDPNELLPVSIAELRALRQTGVGQVFGIEYALTSRDGRTTRMKLGGGGRAVTPEPPQPGRAEAEAPSGEARPR